MSRQNHSTKRTAKKESNKTTLPEYHSVTDKVVEVRTPTSSTRFHTPNEKVELEREKFEVARQERKVQKLKVVLPNSRGMR